ncbi:MAG TPA: MFS transporter [Edaphobacter sp.]|jgi:PAT family beta-lactamase induction signal transducer AmpG|nr:MFS transporter [Edaphobacter sp.]
MSDLVLEQVTGPQPPAQKERSWLFGLLIAPNAVLANGIISGVLSYLLRRQGVSIGRSSEIISLLILPQTIYCLWTPITDFWIRRRSWLIVGAVSSAAAMFAAFYGQRLDTSSAVALMFLSACLGQLVVSSCGGIMGSLRSEVSRRRASSFYQGGSLGFGALGIFILASSAERVSVVTLGGIAAALIAIPSFAAFAAPDRATNIGSERTLKQTFSCIWKEVKDTFLRWRAIPYTLIMIFPMCSGAAIGLLPGIAQDYHVTGQQMAWINGIGGALLTAAGALSATLIPARIRASVAYLSVGLINEATIAILWLAPLSPFTYYVGAALYLFTIGACYALFTAVVLEFLGSSGKSGSGRYSVINGLGNLPVAYMTIVDGRGGKLWGARGLAGTDAVVGGIGAAILLTYFLINKRSNSQVVASANCD